MVEKLRSEMEADHGLPVCSRPFLLAKVLREEGELGVWTVAGLPADPVSIDNAFAIFHVIGLIVLIYPPPQGDTNFEARRMALVLDPQGEAARWLRRVLGPQVSRQRQRRRRGEKGEEEEEEGGGAGTDGASGGGGAGRAGGGGVAGADVPAGERGAGDAAGPVPVAPPRTQVLRDGDGEVD